MANLNFKLFFIFLFIFNISYSQTFRCDWNPSFNETEGIGIQEQTVLGCIPNVSFDDFELTAPFVVNVNIHFYANYDVEEGLDIANKLIAKMNENFNDMAECLIPGPNGIPDRVSAAKWTVRLYSEPDNANDLYGGIWFHQLQSVTNDYNNRVIDFHLRPFSTSAPHQTCNDGFSNTGQDVTFFGFTPGVGCYDTPSLFGWLSRAIGHELGHSFSLNHSAWCGNQCRMIDIDPNAECETTCPSSGHFCDDNSNNTNPTSHFCPETGVVQTICTWSNSNNMMAQTFNGFAITPCQWETAFNFVANRQDNRRYSWANDCTEKAETYYLPEGANVTWGNLMLLNRDIVVTKGATLTINCEVRMAKNCRFVVHRGGKLIIDQGKITNLCPDTRWEEIAVHGNAEREQPNPFGVQLEDDAGILIIQNGSIIEHATTAISTSAPGWSWPGSEDRFGGVVHAEYSEFIDNGRVAEFMRYSFENKSQFVSCDIKETADWDGQTTGITIWACDGINFEGNLFENLDGTGIYGIDYGATIVNGNEFINCSRGIEVLSTHPFSTWLEVNENSFNQNTYDIIANATKGRSGLRISDNRFNGALLGVWIEGNSRFSITDNNFATTYLGVINRQTGTFSNRIANNSFNESFYGIHIQGNNRFLQFTSNCWYDTRRYDTNIQGLNGNLGSVRAIQSRGLAPADNCFAEGNLADIRTSGSESFIYVAPDNAGNGSCYLPTNNLSDGGTNNYTVQYAPNTVGACVDGFKPDDDIDKDKFLAEQETMKELLNQLANNPNSAALRLAYQNSKTNSDYMQAFLLNQWLKERNFTEVEAILALDETKEGLRNLIGYKMMRRDYTAATTLLNAYVIDR